MTTIFMYMSYFSIMILIVFYLPLCYLLLRFLGKFVSNVTDSHTLKGVVIGLFSVFLFLVPTWDAILGKIYLDDLCESDGGTYINFSSNIGGIYFNESPRRDVAEKFLRMGFKIVEMGVSKPYFRYSANKFGEVSVERDVKLNSESIIAYDSYRKRVGPSYLNISVENQFLFGLNSSEVYGGFRDYQIYARIDKYWEGLGSLATTRCTDISKFNRQEHFKNKTQYLGILANN